VRAGRGQMCGQLLWRLLRRVVQGGWHAAGVLAGGGVGRLERVVTGDAGAVACATTDAAGPPRLWVEAAGHSVVPGSVARPWRSCGGSGVRACQSKTKGRSATGGSAWQTKKILPRLFPSACLGPTAVRVAARHVGLSYRRASVHSPHRWTRAVASTGQRQLPQAAPDRGSGRGRPARRAAVEAGLHVNVRSRGRPLPCACAPHRRFGGQAGGVG